MVRAFLLDRASGLVIETYSETLHPVWQRMATVDYSSISRTAARNTFAVCSSVVLLGVTLYATASARTIPDTSPGTSNFPNRFIGLSNTNAAAFTAAVNRSIFSLSLNPAMQNPVCVSRMMSSC
jgi:hypothetical protein